MTDQEFYNLKNTFDEFLAEYQKDKFSALEIKKKDTQFNGNVGFYSITPIAQPATVADPGNVGETYSQAEVQEIVDRVADIIDRLQSFGLIA